MMRILGNHDLSDGVLYDFLDRHRIERWRQEQVVQRVRASLSRYASTPESELQRAQLKNFLAAARKLERTFSPVGSNSWVTMVHSIGATTPEGVFDRPPAQLMALSRFPADLAVICESASGALEKLKRSHRSSDPKLELVKELAAIWLSETGRKTGISGEATWDEPKTLFAKFVKVCVEMLRETKAFHKGFAGLLRRATAGCRNPAEKLEVVTLA